MSEVSLTQFEEIIKHSFLINRIPIQRCSKILISQLAHMPNYGGMNLPYQFVEREMIHLEGLGTSETKAAMPFKATGPLRNFMHKHFWVPGYDHLGINTKLAWKLDDPNSGKFREMARRLIKPYAGSDRLEDKWKLSEEIANEIVRGKGGLMERLNKSKATGDWLIYVSYEGHNYYLCIARHGEDEFILNTIQNCFNEFPFLASFLD